MRIDCGELDPGAVIRPEPGEWHPRMPERLDEEELADWRAGRNAVYQLAALTVGARLAVADAACTRRCARAPLRRGEPRALARPGCMSLPNETAAIKACAVGSASGIAVSNPCSLPRGRLMPVHS